MPGFQHAIGIVQIKGVSAFQLGQDQGENDRLGIGIGELAIRRLGKKKCFDLFLQALERRSWIFQGFFNLAADKAAERR
jgi:hypothetical protein